MKISVIIPVYKVEPYLNRCIDSVINQTLTDFELVLTDDGSPDACGGLCDEYAVSDERLIVIHQHNGGLSAARNVGIDWSFACSDSEWIGFIDSDDWVNKHYLSYLLDACVMENTDIAGCSFQRTDGVAFVNDKTHTYHTFPVEDLWIKDRVNATVACCKLYKKHLWNNIRFPVNRIHEDEYTTYKLLFSCSTIPLLDSALYYYYQNPTGIMRSEWSPRKLEIFEALYQSIQFFLSKGNERLYLCELKYYLHCLASNTISSKTNVKYRVVHNKLKKDLRSKIRRYRKCLNLKMGNNIIYVAAYPKTTYLYCVWQAIMRKMKKIIYNPDKY